MRKLRELEKIPEGTHVFAVATGGVNPFNKASKKAASFIAEQEGFKAIYPFDLHHILWFFDSLGNAKIARNKMRAVGIAPGNNISEFVVLKDGGADFIAIAD